MDKLTAHDFIVPFRRQLAQQIVAGTLSRVEVAEILIEAMKALSADLGTALGLIREEGIDRAREAAHK